MTTVLKTTKLHRTAVPRYIPKMQLTEAEVLRFGLDHSINSHVLILRSIFSDHARASEAETEAWKASAEESPAAQSDEMSPEQLKRYLENLRPEDFGKFNI